jgi:hypothetical protein
VPVLHGRGDDATLAGDGFVAKFVKGDVLALEFIERGLDGDLFSKSHKKMRSS